MCLPNNTVSHYSTYVHNSSCVFGVTLTSVFESIAFFIQLCCFKHTWLFTAHSCNGMEPRLISPCFSVSPASPEHSLYPVSLGVPCDLQPSSTNPQSSSPSDHQPPDSSPSPQNQQVLSSWVGPTGSNNSPNTKKPPQPQPKQPRSPSLQRKNSR